MRIAASRILVRAPGSSTWVTLPVGLASQSTRAMVAGPVRVSWSRSTPRAHPDPGAASLSLICPPGSTDEALLVYDAAIKVEVQLAAGRPWTQVIFGWVSSITRTTRDDGRHVYALTLMDIIGRAAATKIGMTPRPAELASQRVAAINSASPSGPLATPRANAGTVRPRDVDNTEALDLLRDTAQLGFNLVESRDGLLIYRQGTAGPMLTVLTQPEWGNALSTWAAGALPVVPIQSRAIEDAARVLDRSATISQVTVRYAYSASGLDPVEREVTFKTGVGSFSSSALSVATDVVETLGTEPQISGWAARVMAESATPAYRLEATRLLLDRLPITAAETLIGIETRDAAVLNLTDAPTGLGSVAVIIGGTLTIVGRDLTLSDVTLAPGNLFGFRPYSTRDLSTKFPNTPPTFRSPATPLALTELDVASLASYYY